MYESEFKRRLTKELEVLFPGCVVLKTDASYFPGIPDMIVLYGPYWALLEIKRSARAARQPNQEYWVDQFNQMSFSAIIYPENKKEVLDALQLTFRTRR